MRYENTFHISTHICHKFTYKNLNTRYLVWFIHYGWLRCIESSKFHRSTLFNIYRHFTYIHLCLFFKPASIGCRLKISRAAFDRSLPLTMFSLEIRRKSRSSSESDDKDGGIYRQRGCKWWRHQTKTFSALLSLCALKPSVTGEFPSQRPVTRGFDVFFDLRSSK